MNKLSKTVKAGKCQFYLIAKSVKKKFRHLQCRFLPIASFIYLLLLCVTQLIEYLNPCLLPFYLAK